MNINRRGFIGLGAIGVAAVGLAACSNNAAPAGSSTPAAGTDSSAPAPSGGGKVGVSMPANLRALDRRRQRPSRQLVKAGFDVDLQYANDDIPTQSNQIDQMITNGADALIIAAIDGTALSTQLDAAAAAGIPVISYDRLIRDSKNVDFYVSFDNFKVGVAQGQSLIDGLAEKFSAEKPANIELFAGSLDDNNAHFFFNGAMSVLQPKIDAGEFVVPSGQTTIEKATILRWQQEVAQKRMEDLLTGSYTDKKLHGALSAYDGLSRGIITALQNAGYSGDTFPVVTGQDAEIASIKLINDGIQYSTIFKDTRLLAEQAVKAAVALLEGKEPEANDTKTYDNGVKALSVLLRSTSPP